jgi:hypothetical protein
LTDRTNELPLKRAIVQAGDPNLFPELNIPRSTARGWILHGVADVVSAEVLSLYAVNC